MMGQVINNGALYGSDHKITFKSFEACHAKLTVVLTLCKRLNLSMADGNLLLDGKPTGISNPFVNVLAAKLDSLQIGGFSLLEGMSAEDFGKLMDVLISSKALPNDGDLASVLAAQNIGHIETERIKYGRIREGEEVGGKAKTDEGDGDEATKETVQQILAFLRGEGAAATPQISEALAAMSASGAEELGNLLMEAVMIRQRNASISTGETLGDVVIGCLRRTFEGLIKDPSARTQKGKKTVKKTLMVLEKTILEKLHAMTPAPDPAIDVALSDAIEEMSDDLEIDALTAEYVKKRELMDKTEKRMVRYISSHQDEPNLESKLLDAGLPLEGWKDLSIKSQSAPAAGDASPPMPEMGVLAVLLRELNDMMAAEPDAAQVSAKISEMGAQVDGLAAATEEKIEAFGKLAKEPETQTGDDAHKLSRAALVALLAEIVQELLQSVSAIHCAVSMTLVGHVGEINRDQKEVLTVAMDCTHRLDSLLDRLIEVVGLPKGLTPDKDMVYKAPLGRA